MLAGVLARGLATALVAVAPAIAEAGVSPWLRLDHADVRLLVGGPGDGAERFAAVELRLDPGTLTYWRQPGDAGLPPRFDTTASSNVAAVAVDYPAPTLLDEDGSQLFGYRDAVAFPMSITVADPARPATLSIKLDAALCRTLCLPVSATLALPLSASTDLEADRVIAAARAAVPRRVATGEAGPLAVQTVALPSTSAEALDVVVRARGPATLFTEGPDGWAFPAVSVAPSSQGVATLAVPIVQRPSGALPAGLPVRLTLVDGAAAVEVATRVDVKRPSP